MPGFIVKTTKYCWKKLRLVWPWKTRKQGLLFLSSKPCPTLLEKRNKFKLEHKLIWWFNRKYTWENSKTFIFNFLNILTFYRHIWWKTSIFWKCQLDLLVSFRNSQIILKEYFNNIFAFSPYCLSWWVLGTQTVSWQ